VHEAIAIRAEIMRRFEDLCRFEDNTRLSISVIGGGPTGVEMAGAIAELVRGPLRNDHKHASEHMDIYLIEAGPRILPMFSEKLSSRAQRDLEKMGVIVKLNTAVQEVKPRTILVKGADSIPSEVTIWAAGVKGEPAGAALNLPLDRTRIEVDPTMAVAYYPYVWAIGDIAGAKDAQGRFLPQVAPVALQQGKFVGEQILRLAAGKALTTFKYRDKGSMATIGRHKAVVQVGKFTMTGIPAWYAWLWLHLFYLLGGSNKIGTMADWTWNYLTFDRGNRHIMDSM
jgi:NADH dehydrogenase